MPNRLIEDKDAKILYELIEKNRKRFTPYFPVTTKEVYNLKSAKRFVKQKIDQAFFQEQYYFLVFDGASNLVGNVTAKNIDLSVPKCELSYFIDIDSEGQGLMSKALDDLIRYCFESLKIKKIYLRIVPENVSSIKLAEKKGFVLEGTHKMDFRTGEGRIVDVNYYALFHEREKS